MRKIISCIVLLVCTTMAFAQSSLVATLNHNDTVSVYYGAEALKSAYSASVDGDVITLSSGGFIAPSVISKEITIRGAGMEVDTVNNVAPTVLLGDFYVYTYSLDPVHRFVMEGICHDGTMEYGMFNTSTHILYNLEKAQFIRCRFNKVDNYLYNAFYGDISDAKFIQCKVISIVLIGNATFVNSIVMACGELNQSNHRGRFEFINCVVKDEFSTSTTNPSSINYSTFQNCILYSTSNELGATNSASNCIGTKTDMFKNLPQNISNHVVALEKVFKTFRGTYSDTETFELQDSIKTKYLGIDGTEVGIYGGNFPYNPKTMLPKIKKFDVASKSTADGKLKVEIMVSAADE